MGFSTRTLIITCLTLVFAGCMHFPSWPPASEEALQATVIYRTLRDEQRIATITFYRNSPTKVISDQVLDKNKNIELPQTDRSLTPLSYRFDGIYAESKTEQPTRLVSGKNLTDPVLVITPDPHLHILSYIGLQGRKPVLKLRTIYKGHVSEKGSVLPLSASVDSYIISDFIRQEAL
ncbi:hypothetical protein [Sansalvadorimonas verongulae]|uniref:hypothetical protein n=1 Tax=Sansalvadorimonas verongulae TaxID=2172824 RepID=UPI0012BC233B|nr:hypothetical protein [Sansalvadorimonas verongulae]MTI12075.1 hypothetical protein [Sansalvadorimonas verongulae]